MTIPNQIENPEIDQLLSEASEAIAETMCLALETKEVQSITSRIVELKARMSTRADRDELLELLDTTQARSDDIMQRATAAQETIKRVTNRFKEMNTIEGLAGLLAVGMMAGTTAEHMSAVQKPPAPSVNPESNIRH